MRNETFVSVILIVKNRTDQLITYIDKLSPYLNEKYADYEIVIVDLKSRDGIEDKLKETLSKHQSIRHIRLAQAVNRDTALTAGIENAIGDFVVNLNIEVDKPELAYELVEAGCLGNDIVVSTSEKVNTFMYRALRKLSGRLLDSIGYTLPCNSTGTFCFSRRAVNAITESGRSYCKLHMRIASIGYKTYPFVCDEFINPASKKSIISGVKDTLHHMVFNSTEPLRWMSFFGILGSMTAMIFSFYSIIVHLIQDQVAPGWTTTILFMSFLFAMLFTMLSFFGEYLARLLNDTSGHKQYSVVYEKNSSVMLDENRSNVLFSSVNDKWNYSQTGRNR